MSDQTDELQKHVEDWATAELRGDATFLGSALADAFIGIRPRGFMLTKDRWLERHETGRLRYESFGLDEVAVRSYGDAAVTVCRQTAEGVYEDENGRYDIHEQFRATLVFVRQQGRWMLPGLQLSPILGRP